MLEAKVPGISSCNSAEVELSIYSAKTDASSVIIQVEGEFEWASANLTREQAAYVGKVLLYLAKVSTPPDASMRNPFEEEEEAIDVPRVRW